MEEEWAPFELIERLGRTTLYLHGTKGEHKRLDADGVMKIRNAISGYIHGERIPKAGGGANLYSGYGSLLPTVVEALVYGYSGRSSWL